MREYRVLYHSFCSLFSTLLFPFLFLYAIFAYQNEIGPIKIDAANLEFDYSVYVLFICYVSICLFLCSAPLQMEN